MCGLPPAWLRSFDEEAFARHFDTISDMAEVADLENAAGTHPIIPLRVKALINFARSGLYAEAMGLPPAQLSTDELEKATEHLLSVLEPDLSGIEAACEDEAANRFVVRGGAVVAAGDGVLEPAEMKFLQARLGIGDNLPGAIASPDFMPRTLGEMAEDAKILRRKLSLNDRAGLLHVLAQVAMSAGGFVDQEQGALIEVAKMLDLSPEIFRRVVGSTPPASAGPERTAAPKKRRKRKPQAPIAEPETGMPTTSSDSSAGDPPR
jgi:tellurite resistance protein